MKLAILRRIPQQVFSCYGKKIRRLSKTTAFPLHILYFLSLFFIGFGILKALKTRTAPSFVPRDFDLFFTAVSAATTSSMSTVEMEVFSNAQLLVMTALMFVGGEIFTSMAMLHCNSFRRKPKPGSSYVLNQIELGVVKVPEHSRTIQPDDHNSPDNYLRFLGFVVLSYLLVVQLLGVGSTLIYLSLVSSSERVLKNKGIKASTFAIFTIVSTFSSSGFIPTNENMIVFSKNSGLLLILIPQTLLGNTLFPPALRLVLTILGKKFNKAKANELLKINNGEELGFFHLLPTVHSLFLLATVLGFILIGFVLFCALDWNSAGLDGLNTYEKVVGIVFQCANARHSGESIVDLSTISSAILVFFVVMMYLPPYTSFLPLDKHKHEPKGQDKKKNNIVFSQLSYLVIFIILICITERKSLKHDPLNFSVLNITLEVISAYGNVGLTTGYSCERQIRRDPRCMNKWYGLCGKWSDEGKIILILVMLFGRLKRFT